MTYYLTRDLDGFYTLWYGDIKPIYRDEEYHLDKGSPSVVASGDIDEIFGYDMPECIVIKEIEPGTIHEIPIQSFKMFRRSRRVN